MLSFDPRDPFPLLAPDSHSYAEAQIHSEAVDAWLGLRTDAREKEIRTRSSTEPAPKRSEELWIGLPVKSLLTPYTEIRALLAHLAPAPGQKIVDLGAGYGRMGFVTGRHHPETAFTGYELVAERVEEARRCLQPFAYPWVRMEQADLNAPGFIPEPADFYFLYDFGSRAAIEKTLRDLQDLARSRPIVVVGRGRASRDAIERSHPWLSQIVPPEHFAHSSIYRSAP